MSNKDRAFTLKSETEALQNKFIVKSSGSLHDLAGQSGVYWLTSSVTDKPNAAAGSLTLQSYSDGYCSGVYVEADSGKAYSVKLSSNTWIYTELATKSSVDTLNTSLGSPSSASTVTGADAFSKIATLNNKIKQVYYNNNTFTWNTNLVDSTGTNTATITRFGAVCVLNLQCKIRATPATESEDVLFYAPSTLAPESTSRSAIVSNGSDTIVNYCGYGSWTEEGVTKYGAYIGTPVSKLHGKYCFAMIVFVLANNV